MTFVPLDLIIYKNPFKKIKLGKEDRDRGYLKSDVPTNNYSLLLSGGINNARTHNNNLVKQAIIDSGNKYLFTAPLHQNSVLLKCSLIK